MTHSSDSKTSTASVQDNPQGNSQGAAATSPEATDAFIKLAMRNMVSKGGKSLFHFGLTLIGLLGVLVGLAYLTR